MSETNMNLIKRSVSQLPLRPRALNGFQYPAFFLDGNDGNGGDPKEPTAEEKKLADEKAAQEKLDKQFADRAARAAETERKKLLDELGVKDPAEAKALLKSAREADDAKKSDLEKAESARKLAEEKAIQAQADAQAKLDAANKRVMDSEIKINASTPVMDKDGKKVVRPAFRKEALDDVLVLINREGITEENGSYKNLDKALNDLAKAKPWLLDVAEVSKQKGSPDETNKRQKNDGNTERPRIISGL